MPLFLQKVVPEDLESLVRIQYTAFHPTDPLHILIYPSPVPPTESIIQKTVSRTLNYWTSTPNLTWLKIVDSTTDKIVAGAKWMFWDEADEERWEESVDPTWILAEEKGKGNAGPGVEDKEYVAWVMGEVYRRRRERMSGRAALLDICFTDPEYHRRGAGRMLVEWGTRRADELGVGCFVEASKVGRRLYEGCGFVEKEDVVLEGGRAREEWGKYGMVDYLWMERVVKQR